MAYLFDDNHLSRLHVRSSKRWSIAILYCTLYWLPVHVLQKEEVEMASTTRRREWGRWDKLVWEWLLNKCQ